jgi:hypothetical protein
MNNQVFDNLLFRYSVLAFAFVFVLFARGFKIFGKAYKIFTAYMFLLLSILFSTIVYLKKGFSIFPLIHVFFVFGFLVAAVFYYFVIKNSIYKKLLISFIILFTIVLLIQYWLDISLLYRINLFESFTFSIILAISNIIFMYENLGKKVIYFYVVLGSLIYNMGSFILFFGFSLFSNNSINIGLPIFNCHTILTLIYCSLVFWEWKVNFSKLNKNE